MPFLTTEGEFDKGVVSAVQTAQDYGLYWTLDHFATKLRYGFTFKDLDRPLIAAYWSGYAYALERLTEARPI